VGQPNCTYKGHFTHEIESPWPLHFKHSRWWKRRSRSKFTSCYTWGTNIVCEVYIDSYMASNGLCFMVTWTISQNHLLEVRLTQNQGDHGTPNTSRCWFIPFYHMWRPMWINTHWNGIWLRARSHMTSHYTWGSRDHTTWVWRRVGTAFGHFLVGSHNFMVTALGSCVKWP